MPFLRLHMSIKVNKNKSKVNSLRTLLNIFHPVVPIKRASPFISRKLKAAVTVEAALALPFFLFFLLNVMSAINMIGLQSRLSAAVHQTGNQIAFAGYAYEKTAGAVLPDGIASTVLTKAYAGSQVLDYAGKDYLNKSCVKNGAAGISFNGTSIMGKGDIIEICLTYHLEPLFGILGFDGFAAGTRYYGHAWTGYDVESNVSDFTKEDPMVYVTETGTVYHVNRNCTYLNPSVKVIDASEIEESRNQSGAKYYPCELCGRKNMQGTVYITTQGSSYHSLLTCSGLKRTIYTIPLSEVGGRGRCSKCS